MGRSQAGQVASGIPGVLLTTMTKELYFSTDIEADGPIPGRNSMLSFGTVVLDIDGVEHGSFTRNLKLLEGASPDPGTMEWWGQEKQRAAWEACRKDPSDVAPAMTDYADWVKSFPGKPAFVDPPFEPVLVAYPKGYDFMWIYWYLVAFAGGSPFSFSALDVKSFAMNTLKCNYRDAVKRNMPKRWFPKGAHNHVAVDDAREQGIMFVNMLRESRGLPVLG